MASERQLSDVLREFARTMVTDFPIRAILEHLVARIVEIMPITAAGVTLVSAGVEPRYIAASNAAAFRFEKLQTELGEGPCVAAYETGESISMPDLREQDQFPQFTLRALQAGLAAVFTFPLHDGDGQLGALDLYRDTPGELTAESLMAAQTLAAVATAYLINAQATARLLRRTAS
jgi:GAF domain-containing protein